MINNHKNEEFVQNAINKLIGERLKKLRCEKKLKRPVFCEKVNEAFKMKYPDSISALHLLPDTLAHWEGGKTTINLDYLPFFCEVLGCDYSYFFDDKRIAKEAIVQDISNYTGLSEKAIKNLSELKYDERISDIIESEQFTELLFDFCDALDFTAVVSEETDRLVDEKECVNGFDMHIQYLENKRYELGNRCADILNGLTSYSSVIRNAKKEFQKFENEE